MDTRRQLQLDNGGTLEDGLLERDQQLETLEDAFAQAGGARGGVVLVGGEAGIGKSALIAEFCEQHEAECRVLVGRCDPLATPRPLGPLLDVASRLGPRLEVLLGGGDRPSIVFAEALQQLTNERTVVVFEDLHWADEATLDLLRFLGRRLATTGALLVCTYRDDELQPSHPLRVALGDLAGTPGVRRIPLQPLSPDAVGRLADGTRFASLDLYALTGGNPFFVFEVLAGGTEGIPPTVRDAISARLSRLSKGARRGLEAAAVCGHRIDLGLLSEGFGVDEVAVAECLSRGILVETDGQVEFRHQLTLNSVLDSVPAPIRGQLHAKVVAAVRRRGVMPDELAGLAEHAELAQDTQGVLEFAPAAAAWASRLGAHREASAQYARAVNVAGSFDSTTLAPLIEGWAYELHLLGQNDHAEQLRARAAAIWREAGAVAKEADNLRWRSRSLLRLGRMHEARQLAQLAVDMLEPLPAGRELAWAYGNSAHITQVSDQYSETMNWAQKALSIAKRLGDQELVIFSLNDLGTGRLWLGDAAGKDDLLESLRLATEYGFAEHVLRARVNLAAYHLEHYEPQEAEPHLTKFLDPAGVELEDVRRHLLALRGVFRGGWWGGAGGGETLQGGGGGGGGLG